MGNDWQDYLISKGIQDMSTPGYAPESNSIVESHFRLLLKSARTVFAEARGLPRKLWPIIMMACNHLLNLCPSEYCGNMTPYEIAFGKKPRIDHLRVLGCKAYLLL